MILFIVPCYNAEKNLDELYESLRSQSDNRWHCIMVDDISTDNTWEKMTEICHNDERFTCRKNAIKKYALRNIVETIRMFQNIDNVVAAVIDGDDSLCNTETVKIILDEYEKGEDVVWTGHRWDINGINISGPMPSNVNPYFWPWCSSHLRTFRCSLLSSISNLNFKNTDKNWFNRGYDQALMLPVLSQTSKRKYVGEICYTYNINSVSVDDRDWAEMRQISTINLVRSRGLIR